MQKNVPSRNPFPSRRQFLAGCSALTLSAAALPAAVLSLPFARGRNALDSICFGQFATHVGTFFQVWLDGARAGEVVLVEAQPQPASQPGAPDAGNEKFSLIFEGAIDLPLGQYTYLFEHAALGRFLMFIVPVFSERSPRAYYQAIFNRALPVRNRRAF